MRQTVAVGVIKSVEKTEKSGGKGKCSHEHAILIGDKLTSFSNEGRREGLQEEVVKKCRYRITVSSRIISSLLFSLRSLVLSTCNVSVLSPSSSVFMITNPESPSPSPFMAVSYSKEYRKTIAYPSGHTTPNKCVLALSNLLLGVLGPLQ